MIPLEHLSEQQAKAYMLADNKLTDRSSWDDRKVAIVLKELSDIVLDFDLEATGFEPPEIDLLTQSLDPPEDVRDTADEFEPADGPPIARVGGSGWRLFGCQLPPDGEQSGAAVVEREQGSSDAQGHS